MGAGELSSWSITPLHFGLISPTDLFPLSCQAKYFGLAGGAERAERSQQTNPFGLGAGRAGAGRGPCTSPEDSQPARPAGLGAERAPRDPGRLSSAPRDPRYSPWHGKLPGLLSALGAGRPLGRLLLCTRCDFLPLGSSLVFPCCSLHLCPHLSVSSCLSLSVSVAVTPFFCLLSTYVWDSL